jgi:hypothetical protein
MTTQLNIMKKFYPVFGSLTSMIGYTIHKSVGWAIIDFLCWPLALDKWLIYHEITRSVIKETFNFLYQ